VSATIPPRPDTGLMAGASSPELPDARPRSTWGWFEAVGVYFVAFLIAGFATIPIIAVLGDTSDGGGIGSTEIVATIVADLIITGILVSWLARWHKGWQRVMVLPPPSGTLWRHVAFGAIGGVILVPAVGIVSYAIGLLFEQAVGHTVTTPDQVAPGLDPPAKLALVLLAVVVAPVSEEFFFRGTLFRSVRDRHGFWAAALASAIPFGLVHYVPAPAIDALLLQVTMVFTGIGMAWIYERRGTLVAPTAAHMIFNVIGLVTILGVVR
jgi:membrane protease YdiL (CAAX protease family)